MEELEAKWEKYRRVVPLNSDALLKEMSDKITNFRDDLIF